MPTKGGKLAKGDRLRHKETGRVFEVVERTGNEVSYGVFLKSADGLPLGTRPSYKFKDAFLLTEASYWCREGNGPYELIDDRGSMSDANAPVLTAAIITRAEAAAVLGGERALQLAEWFVSAYDEGYRPKADSDFVDAQYRGFVKLLGNVRQEAGS